MYNASRETVYNYIQFLTYYKCGHNIELYSGKVDFTKWL